MATDRQDQYRAEFDAEVTFSNGGGTRADRFRADVLDARGGVTSASFAAMSRIPQEAAVPPPTM